MLYDFPTTRSTWAHTIEVMKKQAQVRAVQDNEFLLKECGIIPVEYRGSWRENGMWVAIKVEDQ